MPVHGLPRPGAGHVAVAIPAPGSGSGHWAGAPSAAVGEDGAIVLAYRVRDPVRRGAETVLACASGAGRGFTTLATLSRERFGAESLERPALLRTPEDRWRLYVSCATPGSKHWRIDLLEAGDPAALAAAEPRTVLAGDRRTAVKDPVVRLIDGRWHAWVCCHPLQPPGEEDRMHTELATSVDGVRWDWHGPVLRPRPLRWDARGARVTAVLPDGRALYDGRASARENFSERTGAAAPAAGRTLEALGDAPLADVRYLDVLELPDGSRRLFYEAPLPDGSHELRTELG